MVRMIAFTSSHGLVHPYPKLCNVELCTILDPFLCTLADRMYGILSDYARAYAFAYSDSALVVSMCMHGSNEYLYDGIVLEMWY